MNEKTKRMTVLEMETKQFPKRMRGYDPVAVRAFLQEIAIYYEHALTENHQLTEELLGLREEAERFRALEGTLKEALLLAQKSADETRHNAHKEAELILTEAKRQAEQIETTARQNIAHLASEIEALQAKRNALIMETRSLLLTHLQSLEAFETHINGHSKTETPQPSAVVEVG